MRKILFYLLCGSYGASIVLTLQQWNTVGNAPSIFRLIAWNIVIFYAIMSENNL